MRVENMSTVTNLRRSMSDLTIIKRPSAESGCSNRSTPVVSLQYNVSRGPHVLPPSPCASPHFNYRMRRPTPLPNSRSRNPPHRYTMKGGGRYDDCLLNSDDSKIKGVALGRFNIEEDKILHNKNQLMFRFRSLVVDPQHSRTDPKEKYNRPCPKELFSSSSTPTVPYSTADILYNSDVPPSPQLDDSRQSSFLEFSKSRERHNSRELSGDQQGSSRRPNSKSGSRRSYSIEKVSFNKESEDNLRQSSSTLPPTKQGNYYRPNGLRNSILKGEPLFNSSKSNGSGRDTDDLIAMGTIWSPNVQQNQQQQQQQQQQIPYKNSSNHTSSANSMTNTILNNGSSSKFLTANSAGGSTSSTAIGQPQLRKNNMINSGGVKSIMVNNAPFSGAKNNLRDSKETEPKYIDPIVGSQASFQQRVMELSALESETIRYEKTKRLKKKVKQDRDS